MSAFLKIDKDLRRKITKNLILRKKLFLMFKAVGITDSNLEVIIVGDRPGPSAPNSDSYHHTPFYSVKHCSFWLNSNLAKNDIRESGLLWVNAYDRHGNSESHSSLKLLSAKNFVALGNNAANWLSKNGISKFKKFDHPQYWKRFKSKLDYPLIDYLKQVL